VTCGISYRSTRAPCLLHVHRPKALEAPDKINYAECRREVGPSSSLLWKEDCVPRPGVTFSVWREAGFQSPPGTTSCDFHRSAHTVGWSLHLKRVPKNSVHPSFGSTAHLVQSCSMRDFGIVCWKGFRCVIISLSPSSWLLLAFNFAQAPPFTPACAVPLTDCDRVDVHCVGVPLGLPLRWSSWRFAGTQIIATAWPKTRKHESTMLDFSSCGGLPVV